MNPPEQRSSAGDPTPESNGQTLGTIALRQVRVSRAEVQDKSKDANPMNRLVPYLDLYGRLTDEELTKLTGVSVAMVANLRRQVVQVDRALSRFTDLLPRLTDAEMVRLTGATPKTVRFWRLCQPRFGMAGSGDEGWSVAQAAETLGRTGSSAEVSGHRSARSTAETPIDSGTPLEGHPTGEMPRASESGVYERPRPDARRASESGVHEHPRPDARRASESGVHERPRPDARRPSESGLPAAGDSPRRHSSGETPRAPSSYRMPTAERDGGRAAGWAAHSSGRNDARAESSKAPPPPQTGARAKSRRGSTQEVPAAASTPPVPTGAPEHPDTRFRQKAVAQQMAFDGAPFPGYDSHAPVDVQEDDGIFIGLELPDPRTLAHPGRRD